MRFMNVGNAIRFMGSLPCPAFNALVDAPANTCLDPVRDYECDLLHTWQLGWLVLSSPPADIGRRARHVCYAPGDMSREICAVLLRSPSPKNCRTYPGFIYFGVLPILRGEIR